MIDLGHVGGRADLVEACRRGHDEKPCCEACCPSPGEHVMETAIKGVWCLVRRDGQDVLDNCHKHDLAAQHVRKARQKQREIRGEDAR